MLVLIFTNKLKFPSPYGVSFILMHFKGGFKMIKFKSGFPSPYRVSFILIYERNGFDEISDEYVSVSLQSIIHSYAFNINYNINKQHWEFPSPYGVSFILIRKEDKWKIYILKFPSPYGVSFILM